MIGRFLNCFCLRPKGAAFGPASSDSDSDSCIVSIALHPCPMVAVSRLARSDQKHKCHNRGNLVATLNCEVLNSACCVVSCLIIQDVMLTDQPSVTNAGSNQSTRVKKITMCFVNKLVRKDCFHLHLPGHCYTNNPTKKKFKTQSEGEALPCCKNCLDLPNMFQHRLRMVQRKKVATHSCTFQTIHSLQKNNPTDNIPVTIALKWPGRNQIKFSKFSRD